MQYILRIFSVYCEGCAASLQRDMAVDYLRRLSVQMEHIASSITNFTATLMLVMSGKIVIQRGDNSLEHKFGEIASMVEVSDLPYISI